MSRDTKSSAAREKIIRERQDQPRWGSDYVPGQLATREEAPSDSRPGTIQSDLVGRKIHVMGNPERSACLLGLFVDFAEELHEGKMLRPEPGPGPLTGYPPAAGMRMVPMRGTVEVADSLGLLKWHPLVRVPDTSRPGKTMLIAFPMLGDLLWYVHHPPPIRCINWTVKATPEDFELPFRGTWPPKIPTTEDIESAKARALIEEVNYRDGYVPTVRVAESEIPWHLRNNLPTLNIEGQKPCGLGDALRADFVDQIRVRIDKDIPPLDTIIAFRGRHGGEIADFRTALFAAIWRKELRVDLLRVISPDTPLRPMTTDVRQTFAHWFNPPRL